MSNYRAVFPVLLMVVLCGCSRYQITFNDRTVSTPPELLSSIEFKDEGLKNCVLQTIQDQSIYHADELGSLVCTHSGITDLDGLQLFSQLQSLNLANNQITSIEPLLFLGELTSVNLTGNPNLSCGELDKLKMLLPEHTQLSAPKHCL